MNNEESLRRELQEKYINIDELDEKNNILNAVLNAVNYGVCYLRDGKIVWCNNVFEKLSGWCSEELVGNDTSILFVDKELWTTFREKVVERLVKYHKIEVEQVLFRRDGSPIVCAFYASYVNKDDISEGIICSVYDLTEKRAMEKLFKASFEYSPSIGIIRKLSGEYVSVNKQFCKTYGYSKEDVIGKTVFDLGIWTSDEEYTKFTDELIENGSVCHYETEGFTKEHTTLDLVIYATLVELNNEGHVIIFETDITEKRKMEKDNKELWQSAKKMLIEDGQEQIVFNKTRKSKQELFKALTLMGHSSKAEQMAAIAGVGGVCYEER